MWKTHIELEKVFFFMVSHLGAMALSNRLVHLGFLKPKCGLHGKRRRDDEY